MRAARDVTADDAGREAEDGAAASGPRRATQAMRPNARPQWTSMPGRLPSMSASADGPRRRLVQAGGIAHRAFDQVVEQRDGDVGQQQAADRLVDAAPVRAARRRARSRRRRRPCPAIAIADVHDDRRRAVIGERQARRHRGEAAEDQRAFAADDHQPQLRRQRGAQRRQQQRRGALSSVFCRENQEPKAPIAISW